MSDEAKINLFLIRLQEETNIGLCEGNFVTGKLKARHDTDTDEMLG